jgi:sirohydrochlorin cobaltochelatase
MVLRGVTRIQVAPVFLAAGGHVLRDLPDRLREVSVRHPGLQLHVGAALGSVPSVIDAMAQVCMNDLAALGITPDTVDPSEQKLLDSR